MGEEKCIYIYIKEYIIRNRFDPYLIKNAFNEFVTDVTYKLIKDIVIIS